MNNTRIIKGDSSRFTQISNDIITDNRLSSHSFRLISRLLSHSDNYKINLTYEYKIIGLSKTTGANATKELIKYGYLVKKVNYENGLLNGYDYIVYNKPKIKKTVVSPLKSTGVQAFDIDEHNRTLNKNKLINKEFKKNGNKTKKIKKNKKKKHKIDHRQYAIDLVEKMKTSTYKAGLYRLYLMSNYWRKLSRRVRKKYCNRCSICGSCNNINVHHKSYERLAQVDEIIDLILLCNDCHKKIHGIV